MAYTPSTHDALCTCETTQPTQETTQDGGQWNAVEFTQEEIDAWN